MSAYPNGRWTSNPVSLSPAPQTNGNRRTIIAGSDESAGAGASFARGSTQIDLSGSLPDKPCEIQGPRSNLLPSGTASDQQWRAEERCVAGVFFVGGKPTEPERTPRDAVRVSNRGEFTEEVTPLSELSHPRQVAELFRKGFWRILRAGELGAL
jgi:hypothetical protein